MSISLLTSPLVQYSWELVFYGFGSLGFVWAVFFYACSPTFPRIATQPPEAPEVLVSPPDEKDTGPPHAPSASNCCLRSAHCPVPLPESTLRVVPISALGGLLPWEGEGGGGRGAV